MTRKPRTLLLVAAVGAVVFFLLGAPEITEGTGTVHDLAAWLQLLVGALVLVALALAAWAWSRVGAGPVAKGSPAPTLRPRGRSRRSC
jgi:hypothetical protein